jgi:hypothetical protein
VSRLARPNCDATPQGNLQSSHADPPYGAVDLSRCSYARGADAAVIDARRVLIAYAQALRIVLAPDGSPVTLRLPWRANA